MDAFTAILSNIIYHLLELVEAVGDIAGQLSEIHFPVA